MRIAYVTAADGIRANRTTRPALVKAMSKRVGKLWSGAFHAAPRVLMKMASSLRLKKTILP
jgi:hypothetical protein